MDSPEQGQTKAIPQKIQLLGLAFAGADLAFEVAPTGLISFAMGAGEQIAGVGVTDIVGRDWSFLLSDDNAALLKALLASLMPGDRRGPLRVTLKPKPTGGSGRPASLSVFRLPHNANALSCALSLGAPSKLGEFPRNRAGLLDRKTFDEATAAIMAEAGEAGTPLRLALVQLDGLSSALSALGSPGAEAARVQLAAALRMESYSGVGATEIADDRFAVLRSAASSEGKMSQRLKQICGASVTPVTADMALDTSTPETSLRAVRFALNRYVEDGPSDVVADLGAMMERTAKDAITLQSTISAGTFHFVYQPIIDLAANCVHHFEALARFDGQDDPGATIRLAEELGMILEFDLAAAKQVLAMLSQTDRSVKIAVNTSAISLITPRYVDELLKLTVSKPALRQRLLLEITETQKINDLPKANEVLTALRKAGHPVCLDDFGAGAATLEYLSHLEVDFVKIDGRYVKGLAARPRDALVIKHVVGLCRELGTTTIAEMVETAEISEMVQSLGATYGQGWHFGKPTPKPTWRMPLAAVEVIENGRRRGVVEQWG